MEKAGIFKVGEVAVLEKGHDWKQEKSYVECFKSYVYEC